MKTSFSNTIAIANTVLLAAIVLVLLKISQNLPPKPITLAEYEKANAVHRDKNLPVVAIPNTLSVSGVVDVDRMPDVRISQLPDIEISSKSEVKVTPVDWKGLPVRIEGNK